MTAWEAMLTPLIDLATPVCSTRARRTAEGALRRSPHPRLPGVCQAPGEGECVDHDILRRDQAVLGLLGQVGHGPRRPDDLADYDNGGGQARRR